MELCQEESVCLPVHRAAGEPIQPMPRLLLSIFVSAVVGGCSPPGEGKAPVPAAEPEPRVADVARGYQQFRAMTAEPVDVDPELAMLCRGITREEVEAARKRSGPHATTAVSIYMNDSASAAFRAAAKAYPVGAVIVKEKRAGSGFVSDGVGGMIKRTPGYDAAHGDWEYFYFEDPARVESGRIESCVRCHAAGAAVDHVFGSWAKGN